MTDHYALIQRLADELQEFINYDPIDPCDEEQALVDEARAFCAQSEPETADGLHLWTNEELEKLADDHMAMDGATGVMFLSHLDFVHAAIAADRTRYARPTIEPVPVSERPWEREGWCDKDGKCWLFGKVEGDWRLLGPVNSGLPRLKYCFSYSLPHHALPVPQQEAND